MYIKDQSPESMITGDRRMKYERFLVSALLLVVLLSSYLVSADRIVTINTFGTNYMTGLPTSGDYNGIAVGDIDGDGDDDMAFGGEDYGSTNTVGMYVYTGNGAGTWSSASTGLPTTDTWGGCAFGDADGDGNIELYSGDEGWGASGSTNKGVGAWEYSSGSWSTTGITSPESTNTVDSVKLQNITGDSSLDLAIAFSTSSKGLKVYTGSGSSPISWTSFSSGLPTSGEYTQVCAIDLNNDGLQDLAGCNYGSGGVKIYTQGSTSWTEYTSSLPNSLKSGSFDGMEVGDVDNDGNADIIGATSGNGLKLALGNGGGSDGKTFSWTDVTSNLPTNLKSGRIFQIVLRDIDGDGDLDLLAPHYSNGGLHLYLGNGTVASGSSFRFTEVTGKGLPTAGTYVGANFLDFDNDGILDIAGATWGTGVKVYRSNFTIIDTANAPPIPRIAGGGTYVVGTAIDIAGNKSSDLEDCPSGDVLGDKLTYDWNLTKKPAGSALTDTAFKKQGTSNAFVNFTPDREGIYDITLAVKDSFNKWSNKGLEAKMTITATNQAPVSDAGENVTGLTGIDVMLNGTASSDPDGHTFICDWNLTQKPTGSAVTDGSLKPSDAVKRPFFTPDLVGVYIFTLAVKDAFGKWSSSEDSVTVTAAKPNDPPVANAGKDQSVHAGDTVVLNGSGSSDPDGNVSSYIWDCTSHEITLGSGISISVLLADPGLYTFSLVVIDDEGAESAPDLVNVTVEKVIIPPPPIQNVTPTIGPFATDLDNLVQGATVKLTSLYLTFTGITDSAGKVKFSQGIPPGNYTMNVTKDGVGLMPDLVIWVKDDGSVVYPGGALPKVIEKKDPIPEEKDDKKTFMEKWGMAIIALVVVLIIIVVLAIVFFVMMSGRSVDEGGSESGEVCPECGSKMVMKEEFGTYYCDKCGGSEE
jgi:ribosomal protein S27AE